MQPVPKNVSHTTFPVAAPEELKVFAEILLARPAAFAMPTGQGRLNRDTVANGDTADIIGHGDNDADDFMTRVKGWLEKGMLTVDARLVGAANSETDISISASPSASSGTASVVTSTTSTELT